MTLYPIFQFLQYFHSIHFFRPHFYPLAPSLLLFSVLSLAFICLSLFVSVFSYITFSFILSTSLYLVSCPWLSPLALCSVCSYYHPCLFYICLPSLLYLHRQQLCTQRALYADFLYRYECVSVSVFMHMCRSLKKKKNRKFKVGRHSSNNFD